MAWNRIIRVRSAVEQWLMLMLILIPGDIESSNGDCGRLSGGDILGSGKSHARGPMSWLFLLPIRKAAIWKKILDCDLGLRPVSGESS
jgi:hypothetical protein